MVQFRYKALAKRKQQDDTDLLPSITRRRGWLVLAALAVFAAGILAWSFVGRLPSTTTAPGIIAHPDGVTDVQSTDTGQVIRVRYEEGERIKADAPLVDIVDEQGDTRTLTSRWAGTVTGRTVSVGQFVVPGTSLVHLERDDEQGSTDVAFLFVSPSEAAGLAPGMDVDLDVDSAPSAAFGVLRGKVQEVSQFPVSVAEVSGLLADDDLARQLMDGHPATVVQVELVEDSSTASGYRWSTKDGPPFPLSTGTELEGTVIRQREAPIDLVFGR